MANKIEKYYSILTEETGEITGKFRTLDDALTAAEHHATATSIAYVVEQGDLAFYSTTSFKDAEDELKAEKKKLATEKMLATKAAKKEAEKDEVAQPTQDDEQPTEQVEQQTDTTDATADETEPSETESKEPTASDADASNPKVGDVFISEKKDKAVLVKKVTNKCIVVDMLEIKSADHGSKTVGYLLDWYIFKKDIAGFVSYDKTAFNFALDSAKIALSNVSF